MAGEGEVKKEDFSKLKAQFKGREMRKEDFEPLALLGFGNGGSVHKVVHRPTGLVLARKMIRLDVKADAQQRILRELRVLFDCNSPYIIDFYGSFLSEGEINILLEYMDAGSLDIVLRRVGRIEEPVLRHICKHTLLGLQYLRDSQRIIHRDVKPSNILVNSAGAIKLCDFGVSGELTNSLANTFVGTRSYMAPERLSGDKYAIESDIWSLGLSLVELATGHFPIPPETPPPPPVPIRVPPRHLDDEAQHKRAPLAIFELLSLVVDGTPPRLPADQGFTAEFQDFVAHCIVKNPSERFSIDRLLEHSWIQRALAEPVDLAAWARGTIPLPRK